MRWQMTNTNERLEAIEKQLEKLTETLPKMLPPTHENLSQFRVAALRKLSRTRKLLNNLIEFIETELITHHEMVNSNPNIVQLTNLYEERGNSDLERVVKTLKHIRDGIHDKID